MKLKKALEIINYYAYLMQKDFVKIAKINDNELEELEDARQIVKEFLCQFK